MSLLIGGVISAIFGLISLIFWWSDFMTIVKGFFSDFFTFRWSFGSLRRNR